MQKKLFSYGATVAAFFLVQLNDYSIEASVEKSKDESSTAGRCESDLSAAAFADALVHIKQIDVTAFPSERNYHKTWKAVKLPTGQSFYQCEFKSKSGGDTAAVNVHLDAVGPGIHRVDLDLPRNGLDQNFTDISLAYYALQDLHGIAEHSRFEIILNDPLIAGVLMDTMNEAFTDFDLPKIQIVRLEDGSSKGYFSAISIADITETIHYMEKESKTFAARLQDALLNRRDEESPTREFGNMLRNSGKKNSWLISVVPDYFRVRAENDSLEPGAVRMGVRFKILLEKF